MNKIPRNEYPRPQFQRKDWLCLNGEWSFEFDLGRSGIEREFHKSKGFSKKIIVPFCPESSLSGIAYKDFMEEIWYQRYIKIPNQWSDKKIILHFGAVDYMAEVFVNGNFVGRHFGGSSSFSFDVTKFVKIYEENSLVVRVIDEIRSGVLPAGKQSTKFSSYGCSYTRTTGIWQTVWIEARNLFALDNVKIIPDADNGAFFFIPLFTFLQEDLYLKIKILDGNSVVFEKLFPAQDGIPLCCEIRSPKLWSPESPFLYNIEFSLLDSKGGILDKVESYAGMRSIKVKGNKILLNNKPIYLRFVLDQGFYPDGIWTAPSDDALRRDIELSKACGFNGARLHQKVFEERFHYWADKLGYLTWAEYPSWGADLKSPISARNILNEWRECVIRDMNHPSIIAWTPLNETHSSWDAFQSRRLHEDLYNLTKALDPTRPINDASGYIHVKTDLWTVHNYEQNGKKLAESLSISKENGVFRNYPELECEYQGQPYLVDEFGGIKWISGEAYSKNSWGYGDAPKTIEEFYSRLESQVNAILSFKHICGYCYTQLTDVEQEQNGIYNYDRTVKFDMNKIKKIFSKNP